MDSKYGHGHRYGHGHGHGHGLEPKAWTYMYMNTMIVTTEIKCNGLTLPLCNWLLLEITRNNFVLF
jgi:hypothetical protein